MVLFHSFICENKIVECVNSIILWTIVHTSYIIIYYYKHYNELEFDAPEIHDVTLKV